MAMASQMAGGFGNAAPAASAGAAAVPPPLPTVVWHVAEAGERKGPFTTEQVAGLIARGEIKPEMMMWTAGMQAWTPASGISQLASYFAASTPPPLPPA